MWIVLARRLTVVAIVWMMSSAIANAATLELVSSAPANNAVDVSRVDPLNLQFSTALSPYSVRADTITLRNATGVQKVGLSVTGGSVTVRPLTPLLPWTTYTLNAQSLVGSAGEQLAQPVAIVFKTRDAAWQPPQLIDRLTTEQWNPVTAVNSKGIRFVAWQQSNGAGDDIWAVRHVPGATAAETPVLIASLGTEYASEVRVFVDENGNAFVTWQLDKSEVWLPRRLWASRFTAGSGAGSGWGVPQAIDGYAKRSGTNLHLVFDHAGNAVALWQEWDCCGPHSLQSIVANRYTQRTGWSKPVHLDNAPGFLAGDTDLQIDDDGNAYAAWVMVENLYNPIADLRVSHFDTTSGWSAAHLVTSEYVFESSIDPTLAVNPRGEALLMWAYDNGLKYAHADELARWGTPIGIDATHVAPSSMVYLDSGIAFAAFSDGVKMFRPDLGYWDWKHPLSNQQNTSTAPRIVADKSGNALVAWTQTSGGIDRVFAKRYRAARGWLNPAPIDVGNTLGAGLEELFLDPTGSAAAAWWQRNDQGTLDIKAAAFK